MTFADLLRRYRTAAGLSQVELAERAGVSTQAISGLERGVRKYPREVTLAALADALGLTPPERAELVAARGRRSALPTSTVGEPKVPSRPRQLPLATSDFVGREDELALLVDRLTKSADRPGLTLMAITGMGGIGKTALAIQAADQVLDRFPDGQLYVDLRGHGPAKPTEPLDALRQLLSSLGVPDASLPDDLDNAAGLYRSILAKRNMLILLDNCADARQIAPLLPGSSTCAVILTSRSILTSIPGAEQLQLDVPPVEESLDLLAQVSRRPLTTDPAWSDVVTYCGGLPLAIRIAGARLASRPQWPVSHLAERLADVHARLDGLELGHLGVRASLGLSIDQLAESVNALDALAAKAFALLGLLELPELTARQVGPLLAHPEREAEEALERLLDVHLLNSDHPGRYRMHDLVQAASIEYGERTLSATERSAARIRWYDRLNAVLWRFDRYAGHGPTREIWLDPAWFEPAVDLVNEEQVVAWLDDEQRNLIPSLRQILAGPASERPHAIRIAVCCNSYLSRRRLWTEWTTVTSMTINSAVGSGDRVATGLLWHDLGAALGELDRYDGAIGPLRKALEIADAVDDETLQGLCLLSLSHMLERTGQVAEGIPYALRSRESSLRIGRPGRAAWACLSLGMLYLKAGRPDDAEKAFAETIALLPGDENARARGFAALNAGMAYREVGEYVHADAMLTTSFELLTNPERPLTENEVLQEFGLLAYNVGDYDAAVDRLTVGVGLTERLGAWERQVIILRDLGKVRQAQGRLDLAREVWQRAIALQREHGVTDAGELSALLASLWPTAKGGTGEPVPPLLV